MADRPLVKPAPISGFPEWLPEEKRVEDRLLGIIRRNFELFGFTAIETAAVERKEVLTAKGVEAKEIYALSRLAAGEGEGPDTDMALHFDLTVPTARYVAQNFGRLTFPFRRYQIQKVWRGERPQAGRFREFYQCDIDIIGNGSLSALNDAEIPVVIHAVFTEMAIGRFLIRMNNRKLLQGFMAGLGVAGERAVAALRALDALDKVGRDKVLSDLAEQAGLSAEAADRLMAFVTGPTDLDSLSRAGADPLYQQGVAEMREVIGGLDALGMPREAWTLDLSIARGLDYYTGTVYETVLVDHPQIGSICSGGRYENLAETFTRHTLPGVGISIGLTRLLSRLFDAGLLMPGPKTAATVLVTVMDRSHLADCLAVAARLRAAGIATEVFAEPKKIGQQLKYADQKGFRHAVLIGAEEAAAGTVTLKTLATGEQATVPRTDLVAALTLT